MHQTSTYPTMHNFITKMCTRAHFCYKMVHCGIWDLCIVRYGTGALWECEFGLYGTPGSCAGATVMVSCRYCNSLEDRANIDEIYGCPIFKWIIMTGLEDRAPGLVPVMATSVTHSFRKSHGCVFTVNAPDIFQNRAIIGPMLAASGLTWTGSGTMHIITCLFSMGNGRIW